MQERGRRSRQNLRNCETCSSTLHTATGDERNNPNASHRIASCLAFTFAFAPGLATTDDLQPEQNKIQTKEKKQTEAGNMKLKKQEKPKPKAKPKKKLPNGYHLLPQQTTTTRD
jgi:hypothetical protein